MKAARLVAFREPLTVIDLPVPEPRGDEALIHLHAVGVCRSDWHQWNQDMGWVNASPTLPITPGHELCGVVERVGDGVRSIVPGQRITVPFIQGCAACANCTSGRDNICNKPLFTGFSSDGAFAEYILVRAADLNCVPVPAAIPDDVAAALGCRFTTGYHAVAHRANVRAGDWLAIFGAGGLGLSAIQAASALGIRVIAVDIDAEKLELAKQAGAAETIDATATPRVPKRIKEITDGGAAATMDAVASTATTQQALSSLRRGGRHVQAGLTSQSEQGLIPIQADLLVNNELEIAGAMGCPHDTYAEIFALIEQGRLDPAALIRRRISLSEITGVYHEFDRFANRGIDVVTTFA